jgi:hypothetical protein
VTLLKAPQAFALPQVTVQVTPAFLESLATVAVSAAVALVKSEVGAPVRVTVIAGGVVLVVEVPLPPHAVNCVIVARAISGRMDWRNLIARFHLTLLAFLRRHASSNQIAQRRRRL